MDSVVKIRILGTEFLVLSTDGEDRAKKVAAAVDLKTKEIMVDDPGAPTTKIALIAAMDFCEAEMRYHRIATKLKKRLLRDEAEIARLSRGNVEEEYLEEITELEEKLAGKDRELRKKEEEISILREDLKMTETYRLSLSEREKEIESLTRINAELDEALKRAEKRISEIESADVGLDDDLENFADFDDPDLGEGEEGLFRREKKVAEKQDLDDSPIGVDNADNGGENEKEDNDESDDDIIIPGYLDDPEEGSQIPRNEDYENDPIENPFGLDFNG